MQKTARLAKKVVNKALKLDEALDDLTVELDNNNMFTEEFEKALYDVVSSLKRLNDVICYDLPLDE